MQRLAREQLARRLVEQLDPAVLVDASAARSGESSTIADEIARLGALLRVPRLERLQRRVERLAEHVEPAAARVGEALRIILEADAIR